jgi:cytochrome c
MAETSGDERCGARGGIAAALGGVFCLLACTCDARADDLPGSDLFRNQCGTCHVVSPKPEPRQGPNLYGVLGRQAGKLKGFKYSPALAKAKFAWSRDKIDAWLTDTASAVPGSVMNYRQADAAIRGQIIDYLEVAGGAAKRN